MFLVKSMLAKDIRLLWKQRGPTWYLIEWPVSVCTVYIFLLTI
uniref:Uncharacterized protein n=1 Tax=Anguilla anguilla TaxID=7936 RepID=A0A0E9SBE3_ANGAN